MELARFCGSNLPVQILPVRPVSCDRSRKRWSLCNEWPSRELTELDGCSPDSQHTGITDSLESTLHNPKVMEATATVAVVAAEDDDLNSEFTADRTRAAAPRSVT